MTNEVLTNEPMYPTLTPAEAYKRACKLMGGEPLLSVEDREKVMSFFEDIMGFSQAVTVVPISRMQESSLDFSEVMDADDPNGLARALDIKRNTGAETMK